MSKREHTIEIGGEIIQPVFYAPLSYGDLTDHISGNSISTASPDTGSYSWDSVYNAYHFTRNSGRGSAASWRNLTMNLYDGSVTNKIHEITVYFEYYINTTDSNLARCVFVGGYNGTSGPAVRSGFIGTVANQWSVYEDQFQDLGIGFNYGGNNPYYVNTKVCIGQSDTSGSAQKTNCWLRNIVIWNQLLTSQQIHDFLNSQK